MPEFDYMVAPEAKAIQLCMKWRARAGKTPTAWSARLPKLYMDGVFATEVRSITTASVQKLYMDGADARKLEGSGF